MEPSPALREKRTVALYLTTALVQEIDAAASRLGLSRSAFVESWLRSSLEADA